MVTHAAPAAKGMTRVGLGIIVELILQSVHWLYEAERLDRESAE